MPSAKRVRTWCLIETLEERQLLAGIEGTVFDDPSGKGLGGSGVPGVSVFIDANDNGVLDAGESNTVTDAAGLYHFDNLALGTYIIRHSVPPGLQFAWFGLTGLEDLNAPIAGAGTIELQYPLGVSTVDLFDVPWVVIDGTNRADVITVAADPGGILVNINGVSTVHSMAGMKGVIARGWAKPDTITLDSGLTIPGLIYGGAGSDVLRGGSGKDMIRGDLGNDLIDGGAGNDSIEGGRGHNHLLGGAGRDMLDDSGSDGGSILEGGADNDRLLASIGRGFSTLFGGSGDDVLTPGSGQVTMYGGSGNDSLGGSFPGLYSGGSGDDRIGVGNGGRASGGPGMDVVTYMEDTHPASIKGAERIVVGKFPHRKKCFLTSAVVQWAGKADDCHELTVLRRFRDGYMKSLPQGPAIIGDYYEYAPRVVAAIEEQKRGDVEWPVVYAMVQRAVALIEAGRNAEALAVYSAEYLRLKQEYVQLATV